MARPASRGHEGAGSSGRGCWWVTRRPGRTSTEAAQCWPSQVTGDSLCSRTLNRCPIIAPEALGKPPHWSLGLHSSAASGEEVRRAPRGPGRGGSGPPSAVPVPTSRSEGAECWPPAPSPPPPHPEQGRLGLQGRGSLGVSPSLEPSCSAAPWACLGRRGLCGQGGQARVTTGGGGRVWPTLGSRQQHPTPHPVPSPPGCRAPRPQELICDAQRPVWR